MIPVEVVDKFAWTGATILHPVGAAAAIVLGLALLALPRRYAVIPILVLACFVSTRQRIAIATIDFDLNRILVLVGWIRLLMRGEARSIRLHEVDKLVLFWVLAATVTGILRELSGAAVINRIGTAFDRAGMYFLFRCLVRDWRDVRTTVLAFVALSVPVAASFINENMTGRNFFSVFGGVAEFTRLREGKLRCQGAYAHPIIAGVFWVSVLPLMIAQWWSPRVPRLVVIVGVGCSLTIIVLSQSSTPLGGVGAVLMGGGLYLLREHMRLLRWSLLGILTVLHLVMAKGVHHLLARIDLVGGSTGWHRFNLIDKWLKNAPEWFVLGTGSTVHWGRLMGDITNQYVLEAVRGGILTFGLFIALITVCYRRIGWLWRAYPRKREYRYLAWALGVTLFAHTMMFFGVSYFGQAETAWYLTLAIIGSMTQDVVPGKKRKGKRQKGRKKKNAGRPRRGPKRPVAGDAAPQPSASLGQSLPGARLEAVLLP